MDVSGLRQHLRFWSSLKEGRMSLVTGGADSVVGFSYRWQLTIQSSNT